MTLMTIFFAIQCGCSHFRYAPKQAPGTKGQENQEVEGWCLKKKPVVKHAIRLAPNTHIYRQRESGFE